MTDTTPQDFQALLDQDEQTKRMLADKTIYFLLHAAVERKHRSDPNFKTQASISDTYELGITFCSPDFTDLHQIDSAFDAYIASLPPEKNPPHQPDNQYGSVEVGAYRSLVDELLKDGNLFKLLAEGGVPLNYEHYKEQVEEEKRKLQPQDAEIRQIVADNPKTQEAFHYWIREAAKLHAQEALGVMRPDEEVKATNRAYTEALNKLLCGNRKAFEPHRKLIDEIIADEVKKVREYNELIPDTEIAAHNKATAPMGCLAFLVKKKNSVEMNPYIVSTVNDIATETANHLVGEIAGKEKTDLFTRLEQAYIKKDMARGTGNIHMSAKAVGEMCETLTRNPNPFASSQRDGIV